MIPNDIYMALVKTGTYWAECHSAAAQLEDQQKSLLAHITLEAKDMEDVRSMAEAKEIALASSKYRDHIRESINYRQEANIAKVKYEATKSLFDAQRTVEASQRFANQAAT